MAARLRTPEEYIMKMTKVQNKNLITLYHALGRIDARDVPRDFNQGSFHHDLVAQAAKLSILGMTFDNGIRLVRKPDLGSREVVAHLFGQHALENCFTRFRIDVKDSYSGIPYEATWKEALRGLREYILEYGTLEDRNIALPAVIITEAAISPKLKPASGVKNMQTLVTLASKFEDIAKALGVHNVKIDHVGTNQITVTAAFTID